MGKKATPSPSASASRIKFLHNTYNISTASRMNAQAPLQSPVNGTWTSPPWSVDEHGRFLEALEQFGAAQATSAHAAWHAIAAAVRTRAVAEVKTHATQYFMHLQQANATARDEYLAMQSIDTQWTMEEDAAFENVLAEYSSGACYPWSDMAARLPGKTSRALKQRYRKLCYDVARIEGGQHVTMQLGRLSRSIQSVRARHMEADEPATTMANSVPDCAVALSNQEQDLLMSALREVDVPPGTPTDLLTTIASGVAALTSSNERIPPQRLHLLFSLTQAREAFNRMLSASPPPSNATAVVEALVKYLDLLRPGSLNGHQQMPSRSPLVTSGLSFNFPPSSSAQPHPLLSFGAPYPPFPSSTPNMYIGGAELVGFPAAGPPKVENPSSGLPSSFPQPSTVLPRTSPMLAMIPPQRLSPFYLPSQAPQFASSRPAPSTPPPSAASDDCSPSAGFEL